MASTASDMFVGRERFATVLMIRLTETVILWLSEDQGFWEDIEQGPQPLGPLGLQQVLVLYFAVFMYSQSGESKIGSVTFVLLLNLVVYTPILVLP